LRGIVSSRAAPLRYDNLDYDYDYDNDNDNDNEDDAEGST